MHELEMRDVMPVVVGPICRPRCFEGVERLAHGAVADGVDVHLEAFTVQPGHVPLQRVRPDE